MTTHLARSAYRGARRLLLAAVLLAGPAILSLTAAAVATPWQEVVLYSSPINLNPGLIADPNGNLYGTFGGGNGSVFELARPAPGQTRWTHLVLHFFGLNGDGIAPQTGLYRDSRGALYGTTFGGGRYGYGVVFRLSPPCRGQAQWHETILHSFASAEGRYPNSKLVADAGGALYGTTMFGGPSPYGGIVFKIGPPRAGGAWPFSILHVFGGPSDDYSSPQDGVAIGPHGTIYGTASGGNGGIAFALEPLPGQPQTWRETVISTFMNHPSGLFVDSHGVLYGTTHVAGTMTGEAFELTPPLVVDGAWTYHSLFTDGFDNGDVIGDPSGTLYGTIPFDQLDGGRVYSLTPPPAGQTSWIETTLHVFGLTPGDGVNPFGPLLADERGDLYGITLSGGAYQKPGGGTIFELIHP